MARLPQGVEFWTNLVPLLMIAVVLFRNSRPRPLRVHRMWIPPTLTAGLCLWVFSLSPPPSTLGVAIDLMALGIGGVLGWWRARVSGFTIDPDTHVITIKASPWGLLLIFGIFSVRFVLKNVLAEQSTLLHVTAVEVTDSFLLMALGLVSVQRIEWLIRARRMLTHARAAKT